MIKKFRGLYLTIQAEAGDLKDDILNEMLRLKNNGVTAKAIINDSVILNYSETVIEEIENAFNTANCGDAKSEEEILAEMDTANKCLRMAEKTNKDIIYKYYLGLLKRYVTGDKRDEFEEKYILKCSNPNRNVLRMAAEIVVAIDSQGLTEKFKGLNSVFASVDMSTIDILNEALNLIREYTIYCERIDDYIFTDTVNNYIESKNVYLKSREKELGRMNNK